MNRPVDPLCRWIKEEMRYESWLELLDALEDERTVRGKPVTREGLLLKKEPASSPRIERMMQLAGTRKGRFAA